MTAKIPFPPLRSVPEVVILTRTYHIKSRIPLSSSLIVVLCDVAGGGDQPGGLRLSLDPD